MLIKRIYNSIVKWATKPHETTPSYEHSEYYGGFATGVPLPIVKPQDMSMTFKPTQIIPVLVEEGLEVPPGDIKNMPPKSWGVVISSAAADIPVGTKVLRVNSEYYFASDTPKWSSYEKIKNYQVRQLTNAEAVDIMYGTGAGTV